MDDTEDDARYPPNPLSSSFTVNFRHNFSSSHRPKLPVRNPSTAPPPIPSNFYNDNDYEDDDVAAEEDEEEEEEEEEEDDDEEPNGIVKRVEDGAEDDDDDEEDDDDDDDDDDDGDDGGEEGYERANAEDETEIRAKRRRLEKSALGFEFVPRKKLPPVSKPSFGGGGGGRNSPADWSEQETFVLLEAWGDRFLQLGRKSLRSDEWAEVAMRVSQASKMVRTDAQCRNRLDTLKKKYKKEKTKMGETGNSTSKWVYFKKMEMLMASPPPRQAGLACGLDSGEYVFMNPRVYLNRSNGLDELRDSPGNSESEDAGDDDESDGLPPRRAGVGVVAGEQNGGTSLSFRLLADSIQKFGETYEKIENSKRQQMMELEKMRIEFHRDLEMQKRQILERAQAEIAKIRQGDDEEIDVSVENTSG